MSNLTLHKAMALVLKDQPDRTASLDLLLQEIDRLGLYMNRDGTPADKKQLVSRAQKHEKYFLIIDEGTIKLVEPEKKEKSRTPAASAGEKSSLLFFLFLGLGIFTLTFIIMSFIYW